MAFNLNVSKDMQMRLTEHRRQLHQMPELDFSCPKTNAYLSHVLMGLGYELTPVAQSGLLAFKPGKQAKTIAFRADMDGLPIQEKNPVRYRSKHEGVMHACGHDAHMAMLLGFAEILSEATLEMSVLLIFEPAEETLGGAQYIVSDPQYQAYDIDAVYALHVDPHTPFGKLAVSEGIMTAQDGDLDITIQGRSVHGTTPGEGRNALLAASDLALKLAQLSELKGTLNDRLCTIGTLTSGEGRNIIASKATLEGTLRAYQEDTFDTLKEAVFELAHACEKTHDVRIDTTIQTLHPPVVNDVTLVRRLKALFKDQMIDTQPKLIAEDFSYFQHHHKGVFILLGTQDDTYPKEDLHSATFDFNERVLAYGLTALTMIFNHHQDTHKEAHT